MSNYRRWFVPGGTFFFTLVLQNRRPLFHEEKWRTALRFSIATVREQYPFTIVAMVLLLEHLHTVWTLPFGDKEYPRRWRKIKEGFTKQFLKQGGCDGAVSASRKRKRERGVWQRRYWEHTVRDETDLERCVDYIHWNPRKHRLVSRVRDWEWSTFHQFVALGQYELDWGGTDPCPNWHIPEWGE